MSLIFNILTILNSVVIFFALYFAYKGFKKVQKPLGMFSNMTDIFNQAPEQEEVEEDGTN